MKHIVTTGSICLVGLLASACIVGADYEGASEQELKGRNKMFATQRSLNQISAYNQDGELEGTMTGAGLTVAFGVHVESDDIYVVSQGNASVPSTVYAHLHRTGETDADRMKLTQLVGPGNGLVTAFYPNVKDGVLYVSSQNSNTFGEVLRFDARTGAPLGPFAAAGTGGLDGPRGLDFDSDGNLYVAGFRSNNVIKFDAATGTPSVLAGITQPCGVTINASNQICVGSAGGTGVHCFETDGTRIYGDPATTGQVICGLDWGRDGRVYATRPPLNRVDAHDIATGQVSTFANIQLVAGVSWGTHDDE